MWDVLPLILSQKKESWKHLWSPDFPSGAAIKSTLAVQSEMSQQQQKAIYMVFG